MSTSLTDKILALNGALTTAGLPYAFGGAFALAYCTAEPRATRDIDINVFIAPERTTELFAALPQAIATPASAKVAIERDGQARLWWDETPVDVFLSNHRFHDHAEVNRRTVEFANHQLPVLACADLAVFKAFFARPKDAIDVGTMVAAGTVHLARLTETVSELLGSTYERAAFFGLVSEAAQDL